jgi:2-dehydropantoate 2-reductase
MFRSILDEVSSLARAEGIAIAPDLPEQQFVLASGLAADSYSSLYQDLVNGRRMELEALHGVVVARARALGMTSPSCEAIYAVLRPWAARAEPARTR